MTTVGTKDLLYEPQESWQRIPETLGLIEVVGVATSSADDVFLFNRGDPPIVVLNRDGEQLAGWGSGQFVRPHGIWVSGIDEVYLTDDCGHSLRKFSPHGELLASFGPSGEPSQTGAEGFDYRTITRAAPPFNLPTNSVVAPNGNLYVTDGYGNACLHCFSAEGELLESWGEPGTGPMQFQVPHGIGVDSAGMLYVADRENSRIQIISPAGEFAGQWTDVRRPCQVFIGRDGLAYVAELGGRAGLFPWMDADPNDTGGRISIFDRRGQLLARWGNQDEPGRPDSLLAPHDLWVDSRGDIYLAEVSRSAAPAAGQDPGSFPSLRKFARL